MDEEIDYINMKHGIPSNLTKEEELLYSYSQDVTEELLMKVWEELGKLPDDPIEFKL